MALLSGLRRVLGGTSTSPFLQAQEPSLALRSSSYSSPGGLGSFRTVTTKLFVSGLSRQTTDQGLQNAFSKFGQLLEARVVTDKVSGRSRGFAFVRYATEEEAFKAKEGMDGKFLDGWVIFAEFAKPRTPKPPPPPEEPNPYGLNIQKTIGWCG
uniref:RRM domain-containing protein n=1 Tax=Araucaria cunninghamii TaxID=56994 RepID=A0A0D6R968_ARACU